MCAMRKLVLFCVVLGLGLPAAAQGTLRVHFIDVGQGDCTLIECPNGNTILVDCGSSSCNEQPTVTQYVQRRLGQNPNIDTLVLTHPDKDHYSQLPHVLDGVSVGTVVMAGRANEYRSCNFDEWLTDTGDWQTTFIYGRNYFDGVQTPNTDFECGSAEVRVLASDIRTSRSGSNFVKNARSIVLMVSHGNVDFLLTGDATFDTEDVIAQRYANNWLQAEILKLGHHGSRATSNSESWIDIIQPEVAIASAQLNRRYGHPHQDVINRADDHTGTAPSHEFRMWETKRRFVHIDDYREAIYSTATSGTIVITSDGSTFQVAPSR